MTETQKIESHESKDAQDGTAHVERHRRAQRMVLVLVRIEELLQKYDEIAKGKPHEVDQLLAHRVHLISSIAEALRNITP
jgi:hypothetical protein